MDFLASIDALLEKAGKLALPLLLAGGGMLIAKRYGYWPATDIPDREAAWIVIVTGISAAIVVMNVLQAVWFFVKTGLRKLGRKLAADERLSNAPDRIRELNSLELKSVLWMLKHGIYRVEGRMSDAPFGSLTIKDFTRAAYDPEQYNAVQFFELMASVIKGREAILARFKEWPHMEDLENRNHPPWEGGNF